MKVDVQVDDLAGRLELDRSGDECRFQIHWAGEGGAGQRQASVQEVEAGIYSVLIDECSYEVKIVPGQDCWYVDVGGRHYRVEVNDPRERRRSVRASDAGGRQNLAAAMPGKVVRVLVSVGDTVEAGQGLVVVEAMKMQNEMKAQRAGQVVQLNAREGATVAAGEILAAIE